jgi:endonuclease/exonuclease/phosphatase family metal-dependent hydrolase
VTELHDDLVMSRWASIASFRLYLLLFFLASCGYVLAQSTTTSPYSLTILSYNIHGGVGSDGSRNLARQAEVIRMQKPDIVLLQEVEVGTKQSGETDQAAELARLLEMQVHFAKASDTDGGEKGNAILANTPLDNTRTLPLSNNGSASVAQVSLGNNADSPRLTIASLQLSTRIGAQSTQAQTLTKALSGDQIAICMGDFNADPNFPVMAYLKDHWKIAAKQGSPLTTPAEAPEHETSYFIYKPQEAFILRSHRVVPDNIASTHRPLLTVIQFDPKKLKSTASDKS